MVNNFICDTTNKKKEKINDVIRYKLITYEFIISKFKF